MPSRSKKITQATLNSSYIEFFFCFAVSGHLCYYSQGCYSLENYIKKIYIYNNRNTKKRKILMITKNSQKKKEFSQVEKHTENNKSTTSSKENKYTKTLCK